MRSLVILCRRQLFAFMGINPYYENAQKEIIVKDLIINPDEHTVMKADKMCHLIPKEFEMLLSLALNCGQVFSSKAIFEKVWKEAASEQDNTVMVHIRKLRDKLGDDARNPKYIHTVWEWGISLNIF